MTESEYQSWLWILGLSTALILGSAIGGGEWYLYIFGIISAITFLVHNFGYNRLVKKEKKDEEKTS